MSLLDTIIIGAGWSGAVAARSLAQSGHRVLVLEARDRTGGRAKTHNEGMHVPIDLGCSFIHGYREGNPAKDIAKKLGVDVDVVRATEGAIYGPDGILAAEAASDLRGRLDKAHAAARDIALNSTSASPDPSATLASSFFGPDSALSTSSTPGGAAALARMLEVPFGAPLERLSLRWTGWEDAFAGSDGAPKGGFQQLVEKVFDEAKKTGLATVQLSESVKLIQEEQSGVNVATDKGSYRAKAVICTIPLGVLKRDAETLFDPALPFQRMETIKGTNVGVLEKLVLTYAEAWWPGASTTGSFIFLPTGDGDMQTAKNVLSSHTLVMVSFAAPSLPDPHPTLLFYLSPSPALGLARFSLEEVTEAGHDFLVERLRPASAPAKPIGTVMTEWHKDPLALGATTTPSVVGEGRGPLDFAELAKPFWDGRLGFAGEHTEMNHRGSVAGAVISGFREADRVKLLLGRLAEG